jgi:hypothetical protein
MSAETKATEIAVKLMLLEELCTEIRGMSEQYLADVLGVDPEDGDYKRPRLGIDPEALCDLHDFITEESFIANCAGYDDFLSPKGLANQLLAFAPHSDSYRDKLKGGTP